MTEVPEKRQEKPRFLREGQAVFLRIGRREIPLTKPAELPAPVQEIFREGAADFCAAFPTCADVLERRAKEVKFYWQFAAVPSSSTTPLEGIGLTEGVAQAIAGHVSMGKDRDEKEASTYIPSRLAGLGVAKKGRTLIEVLSRGKTSTREVMKLLGEAYFLGNTPQLVAEYEKRRTEDEPDFEELYKDTADTKALRKLAPLVAWARASAGERKVIFYGGWAFLATAARLLAKVASPDKKTSTEALHDLNQEIYHEIAHVLGDCRKDSQTGKTVSGLMRLAKTKA